MELQIMNLDDGKSFPIYTENMSWEEYAAAAVNWDARTDKWTAESFCEYVNSKRERGLTDHYAAPSKEKLEEMLKADGYTKLGDN